MIVVFYVLVVVCLDLVSDCVIDQMCVNVYTHIV